VTEEVYFDEDSGDCFVLSDLPGLRIKDLDSIPES